MQVKISSPQKVIYEGDIKQISLPTDNGDITILPQHTPMVTALKPGIIKILPEKAPTGDFVFSENTISLSVSKGMAFVDGKMIRVVTAVATTSPEESADKLSHMKADLEQQIATLKQKGSIEEIEKSLVKLEKINADIQLSKMKSHA